jgi:hypothetical protein
LLTFRSWRQIRKGQHTRLAANQESPLIVTKLFVWTVSPNCLCRYRREV